MSYNNRFFEPDTECAPREVLRWIQSRRLVKLVANACQNVPFYRRKFDEAGVIPSEIRSIDDIVKLPFLEIRELAENYPYGLNAAAKEKQRLISRCFTHSGYPVSTAYSAGDLDMRSRCFARALSSVGVRAEDTLQLAFGAEHFGDNAIILGAAERIGAAVLPACSLGAEQQLEMMRELGTDILCCTPGMALEIGRLVERSGIDPALLRLRAGFFGAQSWTESDRAAIELLLGIKAYDLYGLSSFFGVGAAAECFMQDGMHIAEDCFYPEIIDPDTLRPIPDGNEGELVLTFLCGDAMPLIRLRTGDTASLNRFECACGRKTVRMSRPYVKRDFGHIADEYETAVMHQEDDVQDEAAEPVAEPPVKIYVPADKQPVELPEGGADGYGVDDGFERIELDWLDDDGTGADEYDDESGYAEDEPDAGPEPAEDAASPGSSAFDFDIFELEDIEKEPEDDEEEPDDEEDELEDVDDELEDIEEELDDLEEEPEDEDEEPDEEDELEDIEEELEDLEEEPEDEDEESDDEDELEDIEEELEDIEEEPEDEDEESDDEDELEDIEEELEYIEEEPEEEYEESDDEEELEDIEEELEEEDEELDDEDEELDEEEFEEIEEDIEEEFDDDSVDELEIVPSDGPAVSDLTEQEESAADGGSGGLDDVFYWSNVSGYGFDGQDGWSQYIYSEDSDGPELSPADGSGEDGDSDNGA